MKFYVEIKWSTSLAPTMFLQSSLDLAACSVCCLKVRGCETLATEDRTFSALPPPLLKKVATMSSVQTRFTHFCVSFQSLRTFFWCRSVWGCKSICVFSILAHWYLINGFNEKDFVLWVPNSFYKGIPMTTWRFFSKKYLRKDLIEKILGDTQKKAHFPHCCPLLKSSVGETLKTAPFARQHLSRFQ